MEDTKNKGFHNFLKQQVNRSSKIHRDFPLKNGAENETELSKPSTNYSKKMWHGCSVPIHVLARRVESPPGPVAFLQAKLHLSIPNALKGKTWEPNPPENQRGT